VVRTPAATLWRVVTHAGEPAPRLVWIYALAIGAFYGTGPLLALLLADRFGITEKTVGYIIMYFGGMGVVMRAGLLGPAVRRFREARLARLGLLLLAAGLAVLSVTHDWATLFVAITLIPIGTAFTFPCVTALLSRVVSSRDRGLHMGVQQTYGGIARVLFPLLAGYLIDRLGTGSPYAVAGALVAATLLLTAPLEQYLQPKEPAAAAAPTTQARGGARRSVFRGEGDVGVDRLAVPPDARTGARRHHDLEADLERLRLVGKGRPEILEDLRVGHLVIVRRDEPDVDGVGEPLHLRGARHLLCHIIDVRLHREHESEVQVPTRFRHTTYIRTASGRGRGPAPPETGRSRDGVGGCASFHARMRSARLTVLVLAAPVMLAAPTSLAAQALDLTVNDVGLAIGSVRRVKGLRLNFRDRDLDYVIGANVTIWTPYEPASGRVVGLALGLPMTGAARISGIAAGVFGAGAREGVGGGGNLRGITPSVVSVRVVVGSCRW
jgi:hypothetical protein